MNSLLTVNCRSNVSESSTSVVLSYTRITSNQTFSSNETQVVLKNVSTPFSGRYSCEVSADAPSFHTALVSGEMTVVVVPYGRPVLMGVKPRYRIGDTLRANCTVPGSRPAANLTWVLNDQPVDTRFVRQYRGMQQADLETSTTTLELPLMNQHFTKKGRLKVRCTASIHNIYWQTTEKSAEEERPRGLVNDVVQHVQYRPDDFESVYDNNEDRDQDDIDPTSSSFGSYGRSGVQRPLHEKTLMIGMTALLGISKWPLMAD